jgi:hypothetical protein
MTIDTGLVDGVKLLVAILEVPRYVITEHMLQVGFYHIYQALRDPQKRIKRYQELLLFTLRDKPFVSFDQGFTGSRPTRPTTKTYLSPRATSLTG